MQTLLLALCITSPLWLLLLLWLAGFRDGWLGIAGRALRVVGWLVLAPVAGVLEVREWVRGKKCN